MLIQFGWALPALLLATIALEALTWSNPVRPLGDSRASDLASAVAFFVWSAVGGLVVARRAGNRVGIILLIAGLAGQAWLLLAYYGAWGLSVRQGLCPWRNGPRGHR